MRSPSDRAPWWVVLTDVALNLLSVLLAYWIRYELQWFRDISYHHSLATYVPFSFLYGALMLLTFQMDRVYQHWRRRPWLDQVYRIINATAKSTVIAMAITFVIQPIQYSRLLLIEASIIAVSLLAVSRAIHSAILSRQRARGIGVSRVLVVGAGEVGRTVIRTIVARPELGYHVVGFVDDNPRKGQSDIGRFKALGPLENLQRLIREESIDEVIITLPWMYHRKIMSIVRECERREVCARIVPDLFQMSLSQVDVDDLGGVPLIGVRDVAFARSTRVIKRVVDVAGAALLLIVGFPILTLIALAIQLDSPGPPVFRQTRVGKSGNHFEIFKFRTMRKGAEEELDDLRHLDEIDGITFKIREDPRMTRVGRFLRRTSLDELPQLLNVLKGDMSLVGPRPNVPDEVDRYTEWHKKRLEVRPGISGLWQVSGRNLLSFDEAVLLDIYYIENWSLWLDFKILLRTVPVVLLREGAY